MTSTGSVWHCGGASVLLRQTFSTCFKLHILSAGVLVGLAAIMRTRRWLGKAAHIHVHDIIGVSVAASMIISMERRVNEAGLSRGEKKLSTSSSTLYIIIFLKMGFRCSVHTSSRIDDYHQRARVCDGSRQRTWVNRETKLATQGSSGEKRLAQNGLLAAGARKGG